MSLRVEIPPAARSLNGKAAALERHHPDDCVGIADARRSAKYLTLEDYVRRIVDAAPPLTIEQREHIARILVPHLGAGGLDGAA